uniref:Transcription elongation factor A3 n=1 Tax=Phasianus colchicus TaxID=9054 RepID=A0A669PGX7_PHACC
MGPAEELVRIAKKLDKMVARKSTEGALDLLKSLTGYTMTIQLLQTTRIGVAVNSVRKHCSDEEVVASAKILIKNWKRLLESSAPPKKEKDTDGEKEKKEKEKRLDVPSPNEGVNPHPAKHPKNPTEKHREKHKERKPSKSSSHAAPTKGHPTDPNPEREPSAGRSPTAPSKKSPLDGKKERWGPWVGLGGDSRPTTRSLLLCTDTGLLLPGGTLPTRGPQPHPPLPPRRRDPQERGTEGAPPALHLPEMGSGMGAVVVVAACANLPIPGAAGDALPMGQALRAPLLVLQLPSPPCHPQETLSGCQPLTSSQQLPAQLQRQQRGQVGPICPPIKRLPCPQAVRDPKTSPCLRRANSSKGKVETPRTPSSPSFSPSICLLPPCYLTGDSVRDKCIEMLTAALRMDDDYKEFGVNCEKMASEIEDHIFQELKSTDMKYRNRVRSRISNLKDPKNPNLRRNVLCGAIAPALIARMTAEEMASDELKELRNAMTQEAIREHQMAKTGGTVTDLFQCGKCKKKNCTYNQVSPGAPRTQGNPNP